MESSESLEELRWVAETFRGAALLANMVEGGRTPYLSAGELGGMGFKLALYPGTGFLAAARALQLAYGHLRTAGIGTGSDAPMLPFAEMNALMSFPAGTPSSAVTALRRCRAVRNGPWVSKGAGSPFRAGSQVCGLIARAADPHQPVRRRGLLGIVFCTC